MKARASRLLIDIIRLTLAGERYSQEQLLEFLGAQGISPDGEDYLTLLSELYSLSDSQDMAHIPAEALSASGAYELGGESQKEALGRLRALFDKALMLSVVRFVRIDAELKSLSALFEAEGIDFIPLKGSVLKFYYKNPKVRTSCDIDILVREESLDECDKLLCERLGYKRGVKNAHDVAYYSQSGVHLELHYSLMESFNSTGSEDKLKEAWDYSYAEEGYTHLKRLKGEFFYLYHIAHMAKHFVNGGCGIKPYMDIAVMKSTGFVDIASADALLRECKLDTFAKVQERLCEVWFSDGTHDELSLASEEFIFSGGVYGNFDNYIAMHSAKRGSKFKYLLSRIFLSYDRLVDVYPSLKGKKWLTPFYQVKRWTNLVFKRGAAKRSLAELKRTSAIDKEQADRAQDFMKALKLI